MGSKWTEFRHEVRETIKNTVILRFSRMITQVSQLSVDLRMSTRANNRVNLFITLGCV